MEYLAEFVGTTILVILGNGVVAGVLLRGSKAENGGWIVVTMGWGLGVAMAIYTVGRVSGAHLNPAVTFALAVLGEFEWAMVPGYVLAQVAGGFTGACLVYLHYLPHWRLTEDPGLKLAAFATIPAIRNYPANFLAEVIGTAVLLIGILGIGANAGQMEGEVDLSAIFASGLAPLLVGLLVVSIGLSLGGPTGYAINPARDLGPRLAHAVLPIAGKGPSDWRYAWVPVLAPIIGGILGALLWKAFAF